MGSSWNFKDVIDWGRRLHWLWTVVLPLLGSGTAGVAMRTFLISHSSVPEMWRLPLYLASATIALVIFGIAGKWIDKKSERSQLESRKALEEVMMAGARFALYDLMWSHAKSLLSQLEELWHLWNNENEKLVHPLTASVDKLQSLSGSNAWGLLDARRNFLVLYSQHIENLRSNFSDFESQITRFGYPSEVSYVEAKTALEQHANELEKRSRKAWEEYGRPADKALDDPQ